ncbi:hypothetical protein F2Q70_00018598 [Brassica cretica]|uniref:Retrotransposon gag domain-containing protein n=1 Tax=Brassica cretica TaxID=69181 RepID=A0A8S9I496_BRACR|nr:hypothetical protein F2Q70_00018598 [Brassica cretica]
MASLGEKVIWGSFSGFEGHFFKLDHEVFRFRVELNAEIDDSRLESIVCDFRLSLLLKSYDPSGPLFSLGRFLECSCESRTLLSSSSSEEELGRARMTWTCRRLRDPPDLNGYPRRGDLTDYHQQGNYGRLTSRLSKIIFPAFDGTELRDWLSKCEQFFDIDGTPTELKVRLAAMHLTGKATKWHHNYMSTRYGLFPSWTEYIVEISARFSKLFDDPLAELVALKQGSDSVITFLDKFETARMRLVLPEAHALSIFLANMNPHLSLHTRQFEVTSIASAAKIASLHESSLSHIPQKTRAPFNPYQRPFHKNTPPTTPNEATDTQKPTFIPRNNPDKPPRKYSYQEMQDRRSKGLCMFCDEPFTPGHQLKHKRSQIYVMECDDVDYTSDDNSSDTEQHATALVAAAINNQPDEAPLKQAYDTGTSNCLNTAA